MFSCLTVLQEVERSYHIFYQLLQPAVPHLKERCLLSDAIYDYSYVSQGRTKVICSSIIYCLYFRWTPLMTMRNSSSQMEHLK